MITTEIFLLISFSPRVFVMALLTQASIGTSISSADLFFTFLTLTYRNDNSIKYKQVEKKLIKPVSKDKHSISSKAS